MKTTLIALAATSMVAVSAAHAAGVEIGAAYEDRVQTSDAAAVFVRPFTDVGDYQVGVRLLSQRDVKTGEMYTFIEPQATRMFPVGTGGISIGGTVGAGLLTAKSDSYWYGSAEPKVAYAFNDKLTLGAGVRYRNDFSDRIQFESLTYSVGASYKVAKSTSVTVAGYEKNLDERSTGVFMSITQGF